LSFYDQIIRRETESLADNDFRELECLVRVVIIVRYAKKLKRECKKLPNNRFYWWSNYKGGKNRGAMQPASMNAGVSVGGVLGSDQGRTPPIKA
jgi:hypothetical protein